MIVVAKADVAGTVAEEILLRHHGCKLAILGVVVDTSFMQNQNSFANISGQSL